MPIDLTPLAAAPRLLFAIPLTPLQGHRFQPTGFPGLGAATFKTKSGESLLVESAQSMANRLELTIWDEPNNDLKPVLNGLSHVRVLRNKTFLTDTVLEAHRINSPYLLESSDKTFFNALKESLGVLETGPINRKMLAETLLKYDIGSLLHGAFLAKKELAGGRLRIARALSAFIEADGVRIAASGGVKNDHVHPGKVEGDTKKHFGNIPFARDEYTAELITLYVNLDMNQIRGYGLGEEAGRLLLLLSLYKLRVLASDSLRLRTACDFMVTNNDIIATVPKGFTLPSLIELERELKEAIAACAGKMTVTEVAFNDDLKNAKVQSDDGDEETSPEEEV